MSALESPRAASYAPRPADLRTIETELKQLWKPPGNEQEAHVRACMSNLLIFCATGCDADALAEELDDIVRIQPSRILLLVGDAGAPGVEVDAQISARCHLGAEHHHICSEQVTVRAERDAITRLPSTVRPLLVGDLPTSLWWLSDVPPSLGGEVFDELRAMTDQVIYESYRWPDPALGTLSTAGWADGTAVERLAIADLAWRQLNPWRRLISQTLDPAVLPGALDRVSRVEIEHGPQGLPQAWLLSGWIASRLQWQSLRGVTRTGQDVVWRFQASQGVIPVRIRRKPDGDVGVQSLVVAWNAEADQAEVTFAPAEGGRLTATSPVLGPEPRVLIRRTPSRAAIVAAQLQDLGPDPVFRDALNVSRQMADSFVV